jgi:hypothetical protein
MIQLSGELALGRARRRRDLLRAAILAGPQPVAVIPGGGLQLDPALVAHQQDVVLIGAVGRQATGDRAGRELQQPFDHVLHLGEAGIRAIGGLARGDLDRLLAGHVARGLQAVDAHVHQRPAARHRLLQPPLGRVALHEAVLGSHIADTARGARADQAHGFEIAGLEMAAVADHQLAFGRLARGDHRLGFGDRGRHRLFAHHVLAGLGGADRVFGVHGIGQDHIDDIDVGIVADPVKGLIRVDRALRHAIARGGRPGLGLVSADQGGDPAVLAIDELRQDDVEAVIAQAHDGVADLPVGGGLALSRDRSDGEGGGGEEEIAACKVHGRVPGDGAVN